MAAKKELPKIGAGEVEISLSGMRVVLKPTLQAATVLSRKWGGLQKLIIALGGYELDAYVDCIVVAGGVTEKGKAALPERVFSHGIVNLIGPLTQFVGLLANGGRPSEPPADDDEAEGADPSL